MATYLMFLTNNLITRQYRVILGIMNRMGQGGRRGDGGDVKNKKIETILKELLFNSK